MTAEMRQGHLPRTVRDGPADEQLPRVVVEDLYTWWPFQSIELAGG
jgi:hypothetical protein